MWAMWLAGGWIELGLPATCVVTKLRFGIGGACRCFSHGVIPASVLGVYCGFLQSFDAMGSFGSGVAMVSFSTTAAGDGGGWWRRLAISGSTGFLDLIVISLFLRGLCARWLRQLSLHPRAYLYSYLTCTLFLNK